MNNHTNFAGEAQAIAARLIQGKEARIAQFLPGESLKMVDRSLAEIFEAADSFQEDQAIFATSLSEGYAVFIINHADNPGEVKIHYFAGSLAELAEIEDLENLPALIESVWYSL